MVLKTIPETNIKFIEITGIGENISDTTKRIYFSKSGAEVVIDEIDSNTLNQLELYFSKKGNAVLTAKKDPKTVTFNDYVESSYRGTSWVEEINNGVVESATGLGRLGEHTELIATLKDGGYLIVGFDGRYEAGYKIYQNKGGELVVNKFANEGKYVDMFDLEEAKALAGITDICNITKTDEVEKIVKLLKERFAFDEVEAVDECGNVTYKVKAGEVILTISNVEVQND